MAQSSVLLFAGSFLSLLLHCIAYATYLICIKKQGINIHLVNRTEYDSFKLYPTEITPDNWTQIIWQIFYPFQIGWLFNSLLQFRKGPTGKWRYCTYSPFLFNILYSVGIGLQIPRIILLGNDYNLASFFMAFFSALLLVAASAVRAWKPAVPGKIESRPASCKKSKVHCNEESNGHPWGKWQSCWTGTLAFVSNAIAFGAVWSTFYALVTLAQVLVHTSPVRASPKDAATGCLSVFLLLLIIHIVTDLVLFDSYVRYQLSSYGGFILAMACVLSNNHKAKSHNKALTLAILILASVSMVAKIVNLCVREALEYRDRRCQVKATPEVQLEKA